MKKMIFCGLIAAFTALSACASPAPQSCETKEGTVLTAAIKAPDATSSCAKKLAKKPSASAPAAAQPDSNAEAMKAMATRAAAAEAELDRLKASKVTAPAIAQQPAPVVVMAGGTMPLPLNIRQVHIRAGHMCRHVNPDTGAVLNVVLTKDEKECDEVIAREIGRIATPGAIESITESRSTMVAATAISLSAAPAQAAALQPSQGVTVTTIDPNGWQAACNATSGKMAGTVIADIADAKGVSMKGRQVCTEKGNPSVKPL